MATSRTEAIAPPEPLRALVASGWLGAREARDPALRIESLSRTHVVHRIVTGTGRGAVIKHASSRADPGRDLAREFFVYRLAGWSEAFRALLPRPIMIDERRGLLVLEAVSVATPWPDADRDSVSDPGVATRLAAAMAAWHRATTRIPLWTSPADGILDLPDTPVEAFDGREPWTRRFILALRNDPAIARGLREARRGYRRRCLIHGDIRPDNWILDRREDPPRLRMIDWELSGGGDPLWDLAGALAESVIELVRSGARDPDPLHQALAAAAMTILPGYRKAGGLASLESDAERRQLVGAVAGRLLHVATEWADFEGNVANGLVDPLVETARRLFEQRRQRWTAEWVRS